MCFLNERVVNGGVKREIERVCVCVRERENVVVVVAAGCAALNCKFVMVVWFG